MPVLALLASRKGAGPEGLREEFPELGGVRGHEFNPPENLPLKSSRNRLGVCGGGTVCLCCTCLTRPTRLPLGA